MSKYTTVDSAPISASRSPHNALFKPANPSPRINPVPASPSIIPATILFVGDSPRNTAEAITTNRGWLATSSTDEEIEIYFSDEIQDPKWIARNNPEITSSRKSDRLRLLISFLLNLRAGRANRNVASNIL